jgi:hypothetical protein
MVAGRIEIGVLVVPLWKTRNPRCGPIRRKPAPYHELGYTNVSPVWNHKTGSEIAWVNRVGDIPQIFTASSMEQTLSV